MKKNQALKSQEKIIERIDALIQPHMFELNSFVEKVRVENPNSFVPDFDPLDGGINAKALFLLEKPGPKTDRRNGGSGFISRDNDDMTANATRLFLEDANISRKETILWNLIPMWNGTRKITPQEKLLGIRYLKELLILLPEIKVIILVGNKAQWASKHLDLSKYDVLKSFHPSPIVRASAPDKWLGILEEWKKIKFFL